MYHLDNGWRAPNRQFELQGSIVITTHWTKRNRAKCAPQDQSILTSHIGPSVIEPIVSIGSRLWLWRISHPTNMKNQKVIKTHDKTSPTCIDKKTSQCKGTFTKRQSWGQRATEDTSHDPTTWHTRTVQHHCRKPVQQCQDTECIQALENQPRSSITTSWFIERDPHEHR